MLTCMVANQRMIQRRFGRLSDTLAFQAWLHESRLPL